MRESWDHQVDNVSIVDVETQWRDYKVVETAFFDRERKNKCTTRRRLAFYRSTALTHDHDGVEGSEPRSVEVVRGKAQVYGGEAGQGQGGADMRVCVARIGQDVSG